MKMEYIIIKRNRRKTIKNGTDKVIVIEKSPLGLIQKNFECVNVNELKKSSDEDAYDEIIRGNWDGTFNENNIEAKFSIKQYDKYSLSYLSINVKGININAIELIDKKINKIMNESYILITSYDCISEFYCNKIYRKLNNFERKLKELIFDIYTFSYGIDYYERNFSDELKGKVKRLKDKSISSDSNDIEYLKQSLYALDYSDVMKLLFTPKWLLDDERDKYRLMQKIEKENLSPNDLIGFIENIRPKSDWDRLFAAQIGEIKNIEKNIDELRELRNKVAHCKFFRKNHYEKCIKLLEELNKQIDKALKVVMKIDFQKLNYEYANDEFRKSIELLKKVLAEMNAEFVNLASLPIRQITSNALSSVGIIIKESINTLKIPQFKNTPRDYLNTKKTLTKIKKIENKKYLKISDKKYDI